ncbi:uncharacterized protein [Nicotiana sylvestris]|uniref:uncharacterized protein n=1 Tax=Nicotiana sylvestris TaxID=4096 RepID=UPI00388C8106
MMKSLSINVPLVEALEKMPGYAKFMKDLVTKKKSMNFETIKMTHQVSAIVHSMAPKLEDPDSFTIPFTIGSAEFEKALCDLGENVLVRVDKFILPTDFVILDCEVDYEVLIILDGPFLAKGKALVDVEAGELTFRVGDKKVVFHVYKSMRQPNNKEVCPFMDLVTNMIVDETSDVINVDAILEAVLLNFDDGEMDGFMKCVSSLQGMRITPPTKPSIEEPPILELKPLPPHLRYEFLGPSSTLLVILSSCLTNVQVDSTLTVLQKRKKAIGWTLADIRGISPAFCMQNINLEEGAKPSIEHQRRLNEAMVVKRRSSSD